MLIIKKKNRQQIRGELIAVKQHSLLLLDVEGADVTVDFGNIGEIKIVRKSQFLKQSGIGLLCGGVWGVISGFFYVGSRPENIRRKHSWLHY